MKTHIDIDIDIDIDEDVLATVQKLGRYATKREAVHAALSDMARRLAARQLLGMRGSAEFQPEPLTVLEPRFPDWDAGR